MKHYFPSYLIIIALTLCFSLNMTAQNAEYKLIHQGNGYFKAKQFDKAQNCYMKAIQLNAQNTRAIFNLADTYLAKDNAGAADSLYNLVTQHEKNTQIKSMAWHNRGYIRQVQALHNPKQQQQLLRMAIEHYKQALRLNPKDNDTRYNLALCQRQLKNSPQNNQQDKQDEKKQQDKKQENAPQQQKSDRQQPDKQPDPQDKQQTEQYLNLAKQAEKRALQKLNSMKPRQKTLEKNW